MTTDVELVVEEQKNVDQSTTARINTAAPVGFDGALIEIECDTSNGLPGITIVGLGNKAIDEAKERIRSAINNSKLQMPKKRITLNLAPADLPKDGSSYDVPLAVAILVVSKQLPARAVKDTMFVGELALDGRLRMTKASINFAETARKHGFKRIVMPSKAARQAALIDSIEVIGVDNLRDLYRYLNGVLPITRMLPPKLTRAAGQNSADIADVSGQALAKRALEVAAAGGHNVLLTGPPGTGKTMLANCLTSLLPPLSTREVVEATKLHSLAGAVQSELVESRPFRSPHHSSSHVALIGGGRQASPGEVSLAHHGVLFLDEIPEFGRQALESLRQPLEDRTVTVARAEQTVRYPADFMLVATSNPCPCGFLGDQERACRCAPGAIYSYQQRLSGPLIDRIDIVVRVERIEHEKLLSGAKHGETSAVIAKRVAAARRLQSARTSTPALNSQLSTPQLRALEITAEARILLDVAAKKLLLSARAYMRVLRVARTIADLEGEATIEKPHISEALQFRGKQASSS